MRRYIPEVGALYERVRRPAITLLVATALMAPAGGFLIRGEPLPVLTPMSRIAVLHTDAASERLDRTVSEAKASDGPIVEAWREKALERQRRAGAAKFAREYGIPADLAADIHMAALAAKIEPRVAFGLVKTESSFRGSVVSWAGAIGYTQLLPSTARWIAPGTSRGELFDTDTNLQVGFKYLSYLMDKYDGNVHLALTAYNRGPGTVDRLLRRGRDPDNGYAGKVLGD